MDWNEVCVTRRVFRDGNSEYLLNKTPCRLKDIHQLFMDTGIGRSAYSIMEQGKIDQILSSRPEDRRAIFEEAAGITKFKIAKEGGAAEARGDGGEPAAGDGHHPRGEAADRLAPAAGGKGAALPGDDRRFADAGDPPRAPAIHQARRGDSGGGRGERAAAEGAGAAGSRDRGAGDARHGAPGADRGDGGGPHRGAAGGAGLKKPRPERGAPDRVQRGAGARNLAD